MATSIYQQRLITRRKEQGLCLKCGNSLDRSGIYCAECRKDINENLQKTREWYQTHGICPRCRKNNLFGDEKVCPECSAKAYEYAMRSRERLGKEHYNLQQAELHKNLHHKRIELGICTRCGKREADSGYKTCGICRAKTRNYKREKYGKPDRSERWKQGLCYFCDNPIKDGYKVCEKHYQMNVEKSNSSKAKEARKELVDNKIYIKEITD